MMNTFKHNITSNYQMFFPHAGSCQMEGIVSLYNYIMTYLVGILFVVTTALVFIIFIHLNGERHIKQFREEKDLFELINWIQFLQKWTHSTTLELVWTIIPTIILIAIAVPSFILLYSLDEIVDTQCVVKIIAYQWYWKYEYPVLDPITEDILSFSYLSYMLPIEDLTEENNLRLLEVDTPLVLPINVNVKLIITSKDVIHSFAVPALGIKMDAVPGRLNQVTVHIFKPGTYYGQCSELCGVNHAFMPIVINAVHFSTFETFLINGIEKTFGAVKAPFSNKKDALIALNLYHNFLNSLNTLESRHVYEILVDVYPQRMEILQRTYLLLQVLTKPLADSNSDEITTRLLDTIVLVDKVQQILQKEDELYLDHIYDARDHTGHYGKILTWLRTDFSAQQLFWKNYQIDYSKTPFLLIPHEKTGLSKPILSLINLSAIPTDELNNSIFYKQEEMIEHFRLTYTTPIRSERYKEMFYKLCNVPEPIENFFDFEEVLEAIWIFEKLLEVAIAEGKSIIEVLERNMTEDKECKSCGVPTKPIFEVLTSELVDEASIKDEKSHEIINSMLEQVKENLEEKEKPVCIDCEGSKNSSKDNSVKSDSPKNDLNGTSNSDLSSEN